MDRKDGSGRRLNSADAGLDRIVSIGNRIGDLDRDLVQARQAWRERRTQDHHPISIDRYRWQGRGAIGLI